MSKVTIIDYGVGNLLSVSRAFEYCGAEVHMALCPDEIINAERLILPGVGAFADGMASLTERGFTAAILEFAKKNRPFLGICLGMQMMLEVGEEFGYHNGLGLIPGRVTKIPDTGADGTTHKIPYIGWNELIMPRNAEEWKGTILQNIGQSEAVYFVHSYTAIPEYPEHRLADCYYNGRVISAVIRSGKLYGCQFHPEKSGPIGLNIIKSFLSLT